jgi:hypothetical protein
VIGKSAGVARICREKLAAERPRVVPEGGAAGEFQIH